MRSHIHFFGQHLTHQPWLTLGFVKTCGRAIRFQFEHAWSNRPHCFELNEAYFRLIRFDGFAVLHCHDTTPNCPKTVRRFKNRFEFCLAMFLFVFLFQKLRAPNANDLRNPTQQNLATVSANSRTYHIPTLHPPWFRFARCPGSFPNAETLFQAVSGVKDHFLNSRIQAILTELCYVLPHPFTWST